MRFSRPFFDFSVTQAWNLYGSNTFPTWSTHFFPPWNTPLFFHCRGAQSSAPEMDSTDCPHSALFCPVSFVTRTIGPSYQKNFSEISATFQLLMTLMPMPPI